MKNLDCRSFGLTPLQNVELMEINGGLTTGEQSAYDAGYTVGSALGKAITIIGTYMFLRSFF